PAPRPDLRPPPRYRVEARAKQLLKEGEERHDSRPLEQLLDAMFCARSAEAALHLLGDMACERGDFGRARFYWHFLEPGPNAFPDPQGDVALPRAKRVLARLLAGERAAALAELKAFRAAHPDAVGHLAGRDGNFAATLQALADAPDTRAALSNGLAVTPTTFATDAGRG